jgi:hypothetical protein
MTGATPTLGGARQIMDVQPSEPDDHGVPERTPDQMQIEAARLLANDAREELRAAGFDDEQIDDWAKTYIAEEGSGSQDTFVRWIEARQHRG